MAAVQENLYSFYWKHNIYVITRRTYSDNGSNPIWDRINQLRKTIILSVYPSTSIITINILARAVVDTSAGLNKIYFFNVKLSRAIQFLLYQAIIIL